MHAYAMRAAIIYTYSEASEFDLEVGMKRGLPTSSKQSRNREACSKKKKHEVSSIY